MQQGFKASFYACVALVGALGYQASDSQAASARVRMACAGDYFRFCSKFSPNSQETRDCMDEHGNELSKRCVSALVADGEVSQQEVAQRADDAEEK